MLIQGKVTHIPEGNDAPEYLIEIPSFGLMTQAFSMDEALDMAKDLISLLFKDEGIREFEVVWADKKRGVFVVEGRSEDLVPLMLKKQR